MSDAREHGKAQMRAVYGWDFEPTKPFEVATVDHLFGEIWTGGDLSVRDRRLVLIGLVVGLGMTDTAALQIDAALNLEELSVEDLRYLMVFLAHYAGWPRAAALNSQVEELIARREKAAAKAAAAAAAAEDADPIASTDD